MTNLTILERVQADMTIAMKTKDAETLSTLRMLKAALFEAKTRKAKDELLGRHAARKPEQKEIEVTQRYLPQSLSDDEILAHVRVAITASGAAGPKDMGRVIGAVMAKVKGRADGSAVSRLVKQALGA